MTKAQFYKLRKKAGLRQIDVADGIGLDVRTIKNIERYEREGIAPKKYFIMALKYLLTRE